MTASDTTPSEGDGPDGIDGQNIEDVTFEMLARLLESDRRAVSEAVERMAQDLRNGERPSADDLGDLRRAAGGLRETTERYAIHVAEGNHRSRIENRTE